MLQLAVLKVALRSKNKKTGEVTATYRTQDSCPTTCAFYKNGCYAEHGFPSSFMIANKHGVSNDAAFQVLLHEAPKNGVVRHHVSGDIMVGKDVDRDYLHKLNELAQARPDLLHIMYTHAWREVKPADFAWVVNASCETEQEVEEAVAKGFEAVITVARPDDALVGKYISGKKVIICPEETREGVTCATCKLCARKRKSIVAFIAHGAGKSKVTAALEAKR